MKRHRSAAVFVVVLLAGCGPEGSPEFYRDALQARSELVDSLTFVVDEQSAGESFKQAEKRYRGRMQEIGEKFQALKTKMSFDTAFRKLQREDFTPKRLDDDVMAAMREGIRAYSNFTKNVTYTNVRLGREVKRVQLVLEASVAKKLEDQLAENQPPTASTGDFPSLQNVLTTINSIQDVGQLKFVPDSVSAKDLEKIGAIVDEEVLKFKMDLNIKLPDLEAPPLPARPAWVDEAQGKVLAQNRALPVLGGGAPPFSVSFAEQLNLTNTSGKNLNSASGTLAFLQADGLKGTQLLSEQNWNAGQPKQFPLPPNGATKLRLYGRAQVGNAMFQFDVGLPDPPKKKEE